MTERDPFSPERDAFIQADRRVSELNLRNALPASAVPLDAVVLDPSCLDSASRRPPATKTRYQQKFFAACLPREHSIIDSAQDGH
jgi:hypothetical protein